MLGTQQLPSFPRSLRIASQAPGAAAPTPLSYDPTHRPVASGSPPNSSTNIRRARAPDKAQPGPELWNSSPKRKHQETHAQANLSLNLKLVFTDFTQCSNRVQHNITVTHIIAPSPVADKHTEKICCDKSYRHTLYISIQHLPKASYAVPAPNAPLFQSSVNQCLPLRQALRCRQDPQSHPTHHRSSKYLRTSCSNSLQCVFLFCCLNLLPVKTFSFFS